MVHYFLCFVVLGIESKVSCMLISTLGLSHIPSSLMWSDDRTFESENVGYAQWISIRLFNCSFECGHKANDYIFGLKKLKVTICYLI